jgi:hypothetical protein
MGCTVPLGSSAASPISNPYISWVGKPGMIGDGCARMLPTGPNVIGRCQVDGMALATGVAAEQTWSERLAVARH